MTFFLVIHVQVSRAGELHQKKFRRFIPKNLEGLFDPETKWSPLRKAVRSSLFTKDFSTHTHSYGEESYDEEKDEFSKVCTECGQVLTYEKM